MNFTRGEILFDPCFTYPEADRYCDKYLLILNKRHSCPDDVVFIPATTHRNNESYEPNCNPAKQVFYFDKKIGFYGEKTILQFFCIGIYEYDFLEEMIRQKGIIKKTTATTEEINRIFNCLKRIKEDIPQDIQKLIF